MSADFCVVIAIQESVQPRTTLGKGGLRTKSQNLPTFSNGLSVPATILNRFRSDFSIGLFVDSSMKQ